MKVQLVVSTNCPPCRVAEAVWRKTCADGGHVFQQIDLGSNVGEQLRQSFDLRTVPAVIIDGELVAVGVQTPAEAHRLLQG